MREAPLVSPRTREWKPNKTNMAYFFGGMLFVKGAVTLTRRAGATITIACRAKKDAEWIRDQWTSMGLNAHSDIYGKIHNVTVRGIPSVEKFLSIIVKVMPPSLMRERWAELRQVFIRKKLRGRHGRYLIEYQRDLDHWRFYYGQYVGKKYEGQRQVRFGEHKNLRVPEVPVLQDGGSGVPERFPDDIGSESAEIG